MKYTKRIATLLSVVLVVGCVSYGMMNVEAATGEYPEEIALPITLIDYNADNLLFEYDRDDSAGLMFEMTSQEFIDGVNKRIIANGKDASQMVTREFANGVDDVRGYFAKGLVENEQDENGNIVYKQEVIEELAEYVAYQLSNPTVNNNTTLFKQLLTQIVPRTTVNNNRTNLSYYDYSINNMVTMGWTVSGNDGSNYIIDEELGKIYDATGRLIWTHFGDSVRYYGDGSQGESLVYTKKLDSVSDNDLYKVDFALGGAANANRLLKVQVEYTLKDGTALVYNAQAVDQGVSNFSYPLSEDEERVKGAKNITVRIIPLMEDTTNHERVSVLKIYKSTDSKDEAVNYFGNNVYFVDSGWEYEDKGLTDSVDKRLLNADNSDAWKFVGDGVEAHETTTRIYRSITGLTAGSEYIFSYTGASNLNPTVVDSSGTVLYSNIQPGTRITIPADGKITVYLTGAGESYAEAESQGTQEDWWTRNKFCKFSLTENRYPVGDYEQSKAKFASGDKGFNDITTCMDYTYYMLKNMFSVPKTNEPNKVYYDGLKNIILTRDSDTATNYVFSVDKSGSYPNIKSYAPEFNYTNKYISNNRTDTTTEYHGLFPLDNNGLDQKGYYAVANDSSTEHNFHYAMASHSKFYYYEDEDLFFEFIGDDDVYLFINDKLALDLGGAHQAGYDRLELNDIAGQLGLEEGGKYTFDFYYLERHTTASNFYVNTNIQLLETGEPGMNYYKTDENKTPLASGSTVYTGTQVEVEFELKANVNNLKNINFTDAVLGVEVGVNGLTYDSNKITIADDGVTITVVDERGNTISTKVLKNSEDIKNYFSTLYIDQGQTLKVGGFIYTANAPLTNSVVVTYESPKYAGANTENKNNTAKVTGTLDTKEAPIVDYKIEYYLEGSNNPVLIQENSAKADTVIQKDNSVTYAGYKFDHTTPASGKMTLVEDETQNVLRVYFVKENTTATHYTVEYYQDGNLLDTVTGLTGNIGDVVNTWDSAKQPLGYKLEKVEGVTLVADATKNVVKVYFVKDASTDIPPTNEPTTVNYTVQYFRDGEAIPFVTKTGSGNVGAEISRDTNVTLSGYHFDRTNIPGDVMKLVADANSNVLKVYFVKDQTSGNVTQNNNLPNEQNGAADVIISQTTATPTDDMLPWKLSLVVVLIGLAGLCFKVSRWGKEEWN